MTFTLMPNLHCLPLTHRLAAVLVAVGVTACTVDKNLATASDTEDSAGSTVAEPTTSDGPVTGDTTTSTTSTTDATSTTDDSTTTTGGTLEACECVGVDIEIGWGSYTCPFTCEEVEARCVDGPGDDSGGDESTGGDTDTDTDGDGRLCDGYVFEVNEQRLNCALDVLIEGKGAVQWRASPDGGFSDEGGWLGVLPNREGVMRTWEWIDLSGTDSAAGVVPLKAAAYFQGCKELADLEERFWCMTKWSEEEPTAQCDGPGMGNSGF